MRPGSEILRRSQDLRFAGALDSADPRVCSGTLEDESHGVILKLWIAVEAPGRIEAARFKVFGCSTSIACLSLVAEHLQGTTIEAAKTLDAPWIRETLALPEEKTYAAGLVARLLTAVLASWETKYRG